MSDKLKKIIKMKKDKLYVKFFDCIFYKNIYNQIFFFFFLIEIISALYSNLIKKNL